MKKSRFSISQVFVYLILLFVIVFFSIMSQSFMTSRNILNICRQVSMIGICSVGMTMVLLTGGIDISVGSIIALSGVVAAKLIAENMWPIFPAMVVGVVIGVICGIISGALMRSQRNCKSLSVREPPPPKCSLVNVVLLVERM